MDRQRNVDVTGPGEFQVPDNAEAEYIEHGWEKVSEVERTADRFWSEVKSEILNGKYDDELDTLKSVEKGRDVGPRDSIMNAIAERQTQLEDSEEE